MENILACRPTSTVSDIEWLFPQFSLLPKEIRLMIWEKALPGPRIVFLQRKCLPYYSCTRVWSDKAIYQYHAGVHNNDCPAFFNVLDESDEMDELWSSGEPGFDYGPMPQCCRFDSACPPPILLYVCRASFDVACQIYSRAFGTENAQPVTWFDFERDVLYIDWNRSHALVDFQLSDLGFLDSAKVRHLALFDELTEFWHGGLGRDDGTEYDYEQWICDVLRVFCNLKKLTIVLSQGHEKYDNDLVFTKADSFATLGLFNFELPGLSVIRNGSFNNALKSFCGYADRRVDLFNVRELDRYKTTAIQQGLSTWATLPTIDFQFVTTPALGTQLDRVVDCSEALFDRLSMSQLQKFLSGDLKVRCVNGDRVDEPSFEFS